MNATTKIGRVRPNGLDQTITGEFGIEVFYSETMMNAIFFFGKSAKKTWYYHFHSVDRMFEKINETIANVTANMKAEQEKKEATKALQADLKASDFYTIGDIIVNTWGWEQSNVDFYQVVDVMNKKIRVKEIGSEMVPGSAHCSMSCDVTACKDHFIADGKEYLLTIKATFYNNKIGHKICDPERFYYFHKWDGTAQYRSWYA